MNISTMGRRATGLVALVAFAAVATPQTGAAAETTWDRLKRTQMLTQGCLLQSPYW